MHGKEKYSRGSSSEEITLSGMQTKSKRQTPRRSNSNRRIGCKGKVDSLDQCLANKDNTGEENRSHPLDLSAEGQPSLDSRRSA
jgi:hypothetical protein